MRAGGSLFIITILLSQVVAKCLMDNDIHDQFDGFVEKSVLQFACADNIPESPLT